MIIYNDFSTSNGHRNMGSTRYPSPESPIDALIASCPSFDMSQSPSLQDSPALPSYRLQFGPELSTLMDDNGRNTTTLVTSSMTEPYPQLSPHDQSPSFPTSLFDANVFPEDTSCGSAFGPMLVPNPNNDLAWALRHTNMRGQEPMSDHSLCLSPYAIQQDVSYGISPRHINTAYLERSNFDAVAVESASSSDTDSLPRTPETVAHSMGFGQFGGLLEPSPSQKSGSSWENSSFSSHSLASSANSSFMSDQMSDSKWKIAMSSPQVGSSGVGGSSIRPCDLQTYANPRRGMTGVSDKSSSPASTKRKAHGANSSPRTPTRLSRQLLDKLPPGVPYKEVEAAKSRCEECNRTFQRPEHLTRHKKSSAHAADYAPFVCELERCRTKDGQPRRFNRRDNHKAHVIKVHLCPAAKGRRERVTREEACRLGWDIYFEAAAKEIAKQASLLRSKLSSSVFSVSRTSSTRAIKKENARRSQKLLRSQEDR